MKRIDSIEDDIRGVETYELPDGRRVTLKKRDIEERGLEVLMRDLGIDHDNSAGRIAVLQGGQMVGTVPDTFDPSRVTSRSRLYDPRPGDFRRVGAAFVADDHLGMGDLCAVDGFRSA